jgi:hypothetical protein
MLRVFERGVLRTTFGFESDELIGKWRKLYSEELHNLYSSTNIVDASRLPAGNIVGALYHKL